MNTSKEFCFSTLAVGDRYRTHAGLLAQDIQQHAPGTSLYILTDRPEQFKEFPHVLAFKHQLQSVKGYHDKRFVLKKSLLLFESCMFLDSDVRVLGAVVGDMNWPPGITARAGSNLLHQMNNIRNPKEIDVIKEVAQKLNIDLQQVQCIHEFMFAMRRQDGLEERFFQLWQTISYLFEIRGIYYSESYAMGLAAAKVGLTIDFFREDKFPFFKDNIERVRIQNGQSNPQEKRIYFDTHQEIEYPKRPLWRKITNKLTKQAIFYYRVLRLRNVVKKDSDFQKIFNTNSLKYYPLRM